MRRSPLNISSYERQYPLYNLTRRNLPTLIRIMEISNGAKAPSIRAPRRTPKVRYIRIACLDWSFVARVW